MYKYKQRTIHGLIRYVFLIHFANLKDFSTHFFSEYILS